MCFVRGEIQREARIFECWKSDQNKVKEEKRTVPDFVTLANINELSQHVQDGLAQKDLS